MKKQLGLFIVLMALITLTNSAQALVGAAFGQGRTRFSLNGGYGSFNDRSYGVIGLGAGYYVLDGWDVGMSGEAWVGDKPHIYAVSPEVRYVITSWESFKPYIGAFYKRTFYDDFDPMNSIGGRAGLVSPLAEHTYLTFGVVAEKMYDCNETLYDDCNQVYPELGISFAY